MDLSVIISQIKQEIATNEQNTHFIYLGVGTAAGLREPDGTLLLKNYHQYPPFLQDLKNSLADLHLHIILIDPRQEDPPYMLENNNNNMQDKSLTVYTLRTDVYTEPYKEYNHNNGQDITPLLRDLNNYVMLNNIAFLYHDFTGKNNKLLAEYFDEELGEHLDHVIYGLGLCEDNGCYLDLTDPCSYYPYYINPSGHLNFYNLYYYSVNEKIGLIQTDIRNKYNNSSREIIAKHHEKLQAILKKEMLNHTLQTLRCVFRLITDENYLPSALEFKGFPLNKQTICLALYQEKNYGELYTYLLTLFGKKLDIFANLRGLDMTGREILEFITLDDDPFKWYNNISHFFA
jgi:hypothetical protein